mgnify:FL=1
MTDRPSVRTALVVALAVAVIGLVVRFPGALPGPRVVSAMDHLTVHPLFQEAGSEDRGRVRHPHLSDPALQLAALDLRTTEALRSGQAPLWNPDLYGGTPLLGDGQSRPLSPVTLLKALLPHHPGIAHDLGVAWLFAWLTLGITLLVGRVTKSPAPVLAVGAAAALTTPYLSVWLLHPHASTFVWLPWCLLAVEATSVPAVAMAVFGLWTGGHPGTTLHVAGLTLLWWVARSRHWKPVVGAVAGGLLAAPLWAPLWDQVTRSTTASARVGGSLDPSLLLDLLWPGFHGHPATETWSGPGSWADGQLHPGLAALALGLVGLAHRGPHRWLVRGLGLTLVVGTVASVTGLPGPVAHGRLGSVVALGWAGLAAFGALAWSKRSPRTVWLAPLAVLLTGTWARWNDQHTLTHAEHAIQPADWVAPVREAASDGRILGLTWAAQPNTGALAGLRDLRGYDLPVSTDTHRLMTALSPRPRGPWYPVDTPPSASFLDWWDVRVLLAFPDDAVAEWAEAAGWSSVSLASGAPLQAWANPSPGPAAWVARRTVVVASPEQALRRLPSHRGTVSVEADGPRLNSPGEAIVAERTWDGAARMTLSWEPASEPGLLVVTEAWAPGWRARLSDGTAVRPVRVGGAAIGVPVGASISGADLYYRPDGWILGQRLFVVGLGLLVVGTLIARRQRRPVPATIPDGGNTSPHTASIRNTSPDTAVGQGDASL